MILEVQNGCFGYPKQPEILKDISLTLNPGRILAILGPNGIGKTTLLKCMVGLLKWKSGRSFLDGRDIGELSSRQIWSGFLIFPNPMALPFHLPGWKW